jgi:hypothetical protein
MASLNSPEFHWILQGLLVVLVAGLLLALVVGLLLLVRPPALFAANQRLSRWIDTSAPMRRLETPLLFERLFYRHHRFVGTVLSAGALYVLAAWTFSYRREGLLDLLGPRWVAGDLDWIVAAMEWLVVSLHAAILLVGLIILFRPSLLKNVERAANRWHDLPAGPALDSVVMRVEPGFELYPRLSGLVLILTTVWCLGVLLPVALRVLGR